MKPTSDTHSLALVAACVLAFMAGTTVRADSSYKNAVLADNPLTLHRFSEAGVAPVPLPLATNYGTLGASVNGTQFSLLHESPIVMGDPGPLTADSSETAYTFPLPVNNGNVNAVQVPWQDTLAQNGPFTVEVWCKPASADYRNVVFSMIYYDSGSESEYGWELRQRSGSTGNGWQFISWGGADGDAGAWNTYDATVTPSTWYHVVASQTDSESKLYVNGVLVDDAGLYGYIANPNPAYPMNIGSLGQCGTTPNREFSGSVAEVVYYTNILSDADVLAHYNAASTMTKAQYSAMILTNNPPGYWPLNEQPVTLPVAVNSGSGGTGFNAKYEYGSTTTSGMAAPTYPGLETTNRVVSLNSAQNGFVSIPPLSTTMSSATFECLFRPDGSQEQYAGLICHRDDPHYATHSLGYREDGSLCYSWNWDVNTYGWYSGLYPTPGQWYYAAVSISPTQAKMCLFDGTTWQVAVHPVGHAPGTFDVRTAIGQDDGAPGTRNFNGLLDEAAIYNKSLTEGQLRTHALAAFSAGVAPQFLYDPPTVAPSATVLAGTSFTLTSDAYGTPPLAIQWRHAGTNVPGATSAVYTKPSAAVTDSGDYQIVVTNASGSITGLSVAITVLELPPNATNDLRLWLKLDEMSGTTAANSSTNTGVSGTLVGFPGDDTQWVPGAMVRALRVNPPGSANSEYVAVADNGTLDFSTGQEFSLSAWVKAGPSQTGGASVITKGDGGGGEQFCVDVDAGVYRFYVRDGSAAAKVFRTSVAPNNNWQHIVAAYSASMGLVKVYANGALVLSDVPASSLLNNTHDVTIGSRQSGSDSYDLNLNGTVDDVRIFSRMLSQGDVTLLYTNALPIRVAIEQQPTPASRAVLPGGKVTFSAVASGTPISYQWRRNGANVPGGTDATLLVADVDSTKTGDYVLVASNAANSVTSSPPVSISLIPMPSAGYVAGVMADRPEAYWRLDEASAGSVVDSAGPHDGTLVGSATLSQPGVLAGDSDTCMSFGGGGCVRVPNLPSLNTPAFSIECWAQYQGPFPVPSGSYYTPVSSAAWGPDNSGYLIYACPNGLWETWLGEKSGSWCFNSSGVAVAPNAWTHLVSTFDGTYSRIFVNGTLAATTPAGVGLFVQNTTTPLSIGQNSAASGYNFIGAIDEVVFYQSALSPDRVLAHYQLATSGTNSQPVFVTEPVSQTVEVGTTATFTASVIGAPTISFQWKNDGVDIPGATGTSYSVTNTYYTDGGHQYSLAATNSVGGAVSLPATLTVMPPASQTNLVIQTKAGTSGSGAILELIWPAGTLYSAPVVTGPWTVVNDATLPYYTVSPTNATMFFKRE